jgi:hypothetical protein
MMADPWVDPNHRRQETTMATTTRTKPKRKYIRHTVKSAAPQPPERANIEDSGEVTSGQLHDVKSNNIIPKLKEQFGDHVKELDEEIKQTRDAIADLEHRLEVLRAEREKVKSTLSVLRSKDKK